MPLKNEVQKLRVQADSLAKEAKDTEIFYQNEASLLKKNIDEIRAKFEAEEKKKLGQH